MTGILLLIMFWNMENFFDWKDEGQGSADAEWSPRGTRHWTFGRFRKKCEAAAKTIFLLSEEAGGLPDVVCLSEVENRRVLNGLVHHTLLEKCGYGIIHCDSPDRRGIDVAMLYRKETLRLLGSRAVRFGGDSLRTRDILLAQFALQDGRRLAVAANHHPSKYGGGESSWKRKAALDALGALRDSLSAAGDSLFVACGDFNDAASDSLYIRFAGRHALHHPGEGMARQGRGTIRFEGRWELIDFFMYDAHMEATMKIGALPGLLVRDNVHAGEKPFRTYSGPRYMGGISDHLPVLLEIKNISYLYQDETKTVEKHEGKNSAEVQGTLW